MTARDEWSSGDAYESYIGRWSRVVAGEFIGWLGVDPGARWLDVGSGTGALSTAIVSGADPASVVGIDGSQQYVEDARSRLVDPRVRFEVRTAGEIDDADRFDAVVSGLVLNFVPDPDGVVTAMASAATAGGTVAAYVWDYAGQMGLIRSFWDAATRLDEAARDLDEGVRFPLCDPARLRELWERAGLRSTETLAIDIDTRFESFDDYWTPFLGGQGPAPGYVAALSQPDRQRLRDTLATSLPTEADGSILLRARAWAVRGRSPGISSGVGG